MFPTNPANTLDALKVRAIFETKVERVESHRGPATCMTFDIADETLRIHFNTYAKGVPSFSYSTNGQGVVGTCRDAMRQRLASFIPSGGSATLALVGNWHMMNDDEVAAIVAEMAYVAELLA